MPRYGRATTVYFQVWDTAAQQGRANDAPNLTLRLANGNGSATSPANSPSEVVGGGGVYGLLFTVTETQQENLTICGTSTTSGVVVVPKDVSFSRLDYADTPASTSAGDLGECLMGGRAAGFGGIVTNGTVQQAIGPDKSTPVKTWDLDRATAPTSRTER